MIKLRNLRQQILILEKIQDGKPVSFRITARGERLIKAEEMSQDILIKGERGDLKITYV